MYVYVKYVRNSLAAVGESKFVNNTDNRKSQIKIRQSKVKILLLIAQ